MPRCGSGVSLFDRCHRVLVSDRGVMGKAATGAARRKAGQGRPAAVRRQFRATAATAASKAEKVVLPADIATADAFRIVAGSVLRQIISNQPAVSATNPDGVHQMRIGLRRMRAAISIFAELLQDDETLRLKRELRWLTGRLGPARDLHLLARQIRRSRSRDPGRQSQLADVDLRRAKAFAGAKRAVASSRYRALLRDLARWIEAGEWAANPDARRQSTRRRRFCRSGDRQTRTQGAATGDRAARAECRAAAPAAHRGEEIVLRDRLLRDAVHAIVATATG